MTHDYLKKRAAKGEVVGGGFIVIRRGDGSGRFRANVTKGFVTPFEHPTREAAEAQARRLASLPDAKGTYCVLQQITAIPAGNGVGGQQGGPTDGHEKDREENRQKGREEGSQKGGQEVTTETLRRDPPNPLA